MLGRNLPPQVEVQSRDHCSAGVGTEKCVVSRYVVYGICEVSCALYGT